MSKFKLPKIEELFEAGVHFGHQVRRWNPAMEPYIFAERSGIHLIDLDKTHEKLEIAVNKLYEIATTGGQIIFLGTKRQAKDIVSAEAKRSGALFVNERWLGGTVTNFRVLRKKLDKLVDYLRKREAGDFTKYTKKERLLLDREISKLQSSVGGIVGLQGKPAALVIIDTKREKTAIREAKLFGIPVFGILDTNSDPKDIDYVIPGNDDAIRSIALLMKSLGDAVTEGYKEYAQKVASRKAKLEEERAAAKTAEASESITTAPALKVSTSESTHVTAKAGKKHTEKVAKGEEPVVSSSEEKKPIMENIDAKLIKELRDLTGAGILEIKNALEKFENDVEKTKAFLAEKGKERAASKSDRTANDGLIYSYIHNGGKVGSMIYLSCETDFVAKTEDFQNLCKELAMQAASVSYESVEEMLNDDYIRDGSKKIKDLITAVVAKLGENVELRKVVRLKVGE